MPRGFLMLRTFIVLNMRKLIVTGIHIMLVIMPLQELGGFAYFSATELNLLTFLFKQLSVPLVINSWVCLFFLYYA